MQSGPVSCSLERRAWNVNFSDGGTASQSYEDNPRAGLCAALQPP